MDPYADQKQMDSHFVAPSSCVEDPCKRTTAGDLHSNLEAPSADGIAACNAGLLSDVPPKAWRPVACESSRPIDTLAQLNRQEPLVKGDDVREEENEECEWAEEENIVRKQSRQSASGQRTPAGSAAIPCVRDEEEMGGLDYMQESSVIGDYRSGGDCDVFTQTSGDSSGSVELKISNQSDSVILMVIDI
ncbi:unnamed protein product [Protopolystoma xenopodis]|uniref:Uncharacterized protein n=1 Tax=Protopolystoma xenopodis TaxID=117903 RepID=A0A448XE83_9PLAT|nr:unnamed protein product [Protopolystoma xenopodis]